MPTVIQEALHYLLPPPQMTVSEWSDKYRVMGTGESRWVGPWQTDRFPYMRTILDSANEPGIHTVAICASAQVGKTELILNSVGYFAHLRPCPMLMVLPTTELAQSFSRSRLAPMIENSRALKDLFPPRGSKSGERTTLELQYKGGVLALTGGNSTVGLSSRPIRALFIDECSKLPASAGTSEERREGDPMALAQQRTRTYKGKNFHCYTSTPGNKEHCRITAEFENGDQRRYFMPCPHCGEMQDLDFSRMSARFKKDDGSVIKGSAFFDCANADCKLPIKEQHRDTMLAEGEWRPTAEAKVPGTASYHLWSAMSPVVSWDSIIAEDLRTKGDAEKEQVFRNAWLGLPYEPPDQIRLADYDLGAMTLDYVCPPHVVCITAGVDVQLDSLHIAICGWHGAHRKQRCHVIERIAIEGDTQTAAPWDQLSHIITSRRYILPARQEGASRTLRIMACGVDSRFRTESVDGFISRDEIQAHRACFMLQGVDVPTGAIVQACKQPSTKRARSRMRTRAPHPIWSVASNAAKDYLFSLLTQRGGITFSPNLDDTFFKEFASEKQVSTTFRGRSVRRWVNAKGVRNESIDVVCYALAALHIAVPAQYNEQWDKLCRVAPKLPRGGPRGDDVVITAPGDTLAKQPAARLQSSRRPGVRRIGKARRVR